MIYASDRLYIDLLDTVKNISSGDMFIRMGDLNARVGVNLQQDTLSKTFSPFTEDENLAPSQRPTYQH